MLSAIAARDFGFLAATDLASLLERNLNSWESLDRYRGHPYNWYDTTKRIPLTPRYISTADNGNLAAAFLTAQEGLRDIVQAPLFSPELSRGVVESVRMVEQSLARLQPRGARFVSPALDALESRLVALRRVATRVDGEYGWYTWAAQLDRQAERLPKLLDDVQKSLRLHATEFSTKFELLTSQIVGIKRDADAFLAWMRLLAPEARPASNSSEWQAAFTELSRTLSETISLNRICGLSHEFAPLIERLREAASSAAAGSIGPSPATEWLEEWTSELDRGVEQASLCRDRLDWLGRRYESLALEMDFTLLYNPQRRLFSVGFNLEEGQLDRAHYDLLASEARIASQVAIAKGDVEHRHWFQLGRAATEATPGHRGLLSWGGTMFEYLMPALVSRYVPGSLLERSCAAAVERQIAYGQQRRVPWGISESSFAALGANSDYHYQSFGVPGLGLKRGLSKDLVISPYSTALALAVRPAEACRQFPLPFEGRGRRPVGFLRSRRTIRLNACRKAIVASWSTHTWHIIKGCRWSRSPTRCSIIAYSGVSSVNR